MHTFKINKIGLIAYLLMHDKKDDDNTEFIAQVDEMDRPAERGRWFKFKSDKSFDDWQLQYSGSRERLHDEFVCNVRDRIKGKRA